MARRKMKTTMELCGNSSPISEIHRTFNAIVHHENGPSLDYGVAVVKWMMKITLSTLESKIHRDSSYMETWKIVIHFQFIRMI